MAAPQSSPELSVVSPESKPEATPSSSRESAPGPADGRQAPTSRRRSVPLWVLLLVAVVGAILFINQYQRSQMLSAQVVALNAELEQASQQLAAYQSHLEAVRASVGDLSDRIGGLVGLVNQDPLAVSEAPAAQELIPAAAEPRALVEPELPAELPVEGGAAVDLQGAVDAAAAPAAEALLAPALSTPFAQPEVGELAPEPDPLSADLPGLGFGYSHDGPAI